MLNIPVANWANISIDVLSFVSECFKSSTFRSIDYISISAYCKVRRIFSMRSSLSETNKNLISEDLTLDFFELLPRNLSLPQNINFTNFNFTYEKIRFELDEIKSNDINSGSIISSSNNLNIVLNHKEIKNQENKNSNMISPNKNRHNEEGKNNLNKNFKSNFNKIKNLDVNNHLNNYNSDANNKINNNNNENTNYQTNGISNFSTSNKTGTNGLTTKNNNRGKSHTKINKFNKNAVANLTNISSNNENENFNVNVNINNNVKSPKIEGNVKAVKNENLKKNLFDKNKNKIKYNIPTKINKFLNDKNTNNNQKANGNANKQTNDKISGSLGNSSAGGKTKAETANYSEKNNKSETSNMQIKLNKQSNGLSKNNEYDYKSNFLLLNTLNYRNIDKWENSKDNGGDSIEEIYEIEERK